MKIMKADEMWFWLTSQVFFFVLYSHDSLQPVIYSPVCLFCQLDCFWEWTTMPVCNVVIFLGLPHSLLPSTTPNITFLISLWSSILQMCPKCWEFLYRVHRLSLFLHFFLYNLVAEFVSPANYQYSCITSHIEGQELSSIWCFYSPYAGSTEQT